MSYFSKWFGSKERRILILGLDGAGKFFFRLIMLKSTTEEDS